MSAAVGMTPAAAAPKISAGSAWSRSSPIAIGMNGTSRYGQPEPDSRKRRRSATSSGELAQVAVGFDAPPAGDGVQLVGQLPAIGAWVALVVGGGALERHAAGVV